VFAEPGRRGPGSAFASKRQVGVPLPPRP